MKNLLSRTILSLSATLIVMGMLVFFSADTFDYWQGWIFIALYSACSIFAVTSFWRNDKPLLERRMRGGPWAEKDPVQKIIMTIASLCFVAFLVVPGLDHRFGWSHVHFFVVIVGDILVLVGFYAVYRVLRENSFAAATIKTSGDQKVISTGPYALVRHPMYSSMIVFLTGIPLSLASYWGILLLVIMIPTLVWRLVEEEKHLARDLPGYKQYQTRVHWRLLPGLF